MDDALKRLDMSEEEATRLREAMDKPEFMEMMRDYMREIADPKNKDELDAFIKEAEEGVGISPPARPDVAHGMQVPRGSVIMKPTPWLCLKSRYASTGQKVFINIHGSPLIAKASVLVGPPSTVEAGATGSPGFGKNLRVPYSLLERRETKDNKGSPVPLFDVVFSKESVADAVRDKKLHRMLLVTAMDAVEKVEEGGNRLDRGKMVVLQGCKCKGGPPIPVAVKKESIATTPPTQTHTQTQAESDDTREQHPAAERKTSTDNTTRTPAFKIVERGRLPPAEFEALRGVGVDTRRPEELVVTIELPGLSSMAGVDLHVSASALSLRKEACYALDTPLPYAVKDKEGTAKFIKKKEQLVVTLPVVPVTRDEAEAIAAKYKDTQAAIDRRREAMDDDVRDDGDGQTEPPEHQEQEQEEEEEDRQYVTPKYTIRQSLSHVTAVIKVKGVLATSVTVRALSALRVECVMSEQAALHRWFRIELHLSGRVRPSSLRHDVNVKNMVVQAEKEEKGMWSTIEGDGSHDKASPRAATEAPTVDGDKHVQFSEKLERGKDRKARLHGEQKSVLKSTPSLDPSSPAAGPTVPSLELPPQAPTDGLLSPTAKSNLPTVLPLGGPDPVQRRPVGVWGDDELFDYLLERWPDALSVE